VTTSKSELIEKLKVSQISASSSTMSSSGFSGKEISVMVKHEALAAA
jgi:hypothetical protein